jgi:Secretion system C-terminal sorting domain
MNKFLLLSFLIIPLLFKNTAQAQCPGNALLNESFFGATPANAPTGWYAKGVDYKSGFAPFALGRTDSFRLGMNDVLDTAFAPAVVCPSALNFYWRSSGASNAYAVYVQWSLDKTTWTTLDSMVTTGSGAPTTYQSKSIPFVYGTLAPPFKVYFRWNMVRRTIGTFYLDDVCITPGVCHATASQLRFTQYTNNCTPSGIPFSTTVCATDANGYVDTTYNAVITLSKASGTGLLTGTLSKSAVAGCATFNAATFTGVSPLSIVANSGAFTSPTPLTGLDIQATCPNVDTLKIVTYNLLNFPNGGVYALGGACSVQELGPARWDTLKAITQYMNLDVMIVQELQTEEGADSIVTRALNVGGVTKYAKAPYVENRSTANKKYNNECFYNTDKLVLLSVNTFGTTIRDATQYVFYCKDPLLNVHNDTTFLDLYSIHTKAKGLGAAQATLDSIQRASDCQLVMDSIRYRYTAERNGIIGGDMNLYTNVEGAFVNFTTGLYKFNDPVPANPPNAENAWESNPAYAALHTQAARAGWRQSLECGARGGLDSRLDFLLNTDPIMNGTKNIKYIPTTYKAFGNSGNLFNKSVDTPTNTTGIPAFVLRSLANMSDHIPVEEKLEVTYPILSPLGIADRLQLMGKLMSSDAIINWDMQIDAQIKKIELLCDNQVIYTQTNNFTNTSFTHNNVKNGTHQYKLRVQTINGSYVMSNIILLTQTKQIAFDISPNPFSNQLVITNTKNMNVGNCSITITDATGQIIWFKNALPANQDVIVNTAHFPQGIYFVSMRDAEQTKTVKVIKYQ